MGTVVRRTWEQGLRDLARIVGGYRDPAKARQLALQVGMLDVVKQGVRRLHTSIVQAKAEGRPLTQRFVQELIDEQGFRDDLARQMEVAIEFAVMDAENQVVDMAIEGYKDAHDLIIESLGFDSYSDMKQALGDAQQQIPLTERGFLQGDRPQLARGGRVHATPLGAGDLPPNPERELDNILAGLRPGGEAYNPFTQQFEERIAARRGKTVDLRGERAVPFDRAVDPRDSLFPDQRGRPETAFPSQFADLAGSLGKELPEYTRFDSELYRGNLRQWMMDQIGFDRDSRAAERGSLARRDARHGQLQPVLQDGMRTLVRGVLRGDNPRTVARRLADDLGIAHSKALTFTRTEMIKANRRARLDAMSENPDVVQGWIWTAKLDSRTCAICWSQHGRVYPVVPNPHGEVPNASAFASHANCRCTPIPETRSWEDILQRAGYASDEAHEIAAKLPDTTATVPFGPRLFSELDPAEQRRILGPTRWELYNPNGKYQWTLEDLVQTTWHPAWGPGRRLKRLADYPGGGITPIHLRGKKKKPAPEGLTAAELELAAGDIDLSETGREIGHGTTNTVYKAETSEGVDVVVKPASEGWAATGGHTIHDGIPNDGRDPQRELAAWKVAKGLKRAGADFNLPAAVLKEVRDSYGDLTEAVVQQWIDGDDIGDAVGTWSQLLWEGYANERELADWAIFDYIIGNQDRHAGQGKIAYEDGLVWLMDHGLAFPQNQGPTVRGWNQQIMEALSLNNGSLRLDRRMIELIEEFAENEWPALREELRGILNSAEIEGVEERLDYATQVGEFDIRINR